MTKFEKYLGICKGKVSYFRS